ncbi:hypothetical protein CROQUDRAFT_96863 [Cronartium quercuum f. sp. fusiforme G11]|uniref:Uncharacterized protein n=1 Tax=Cronartium quercuum f. sp. fusiforme G11 TaxID=708437 RepID=A0A9P6NF10_9BASI|nr:hypothetical protein CROQUDRAFT_96863 [Cronartium quercuum f. sp. fusiforme G11]
MNALESPSLLFFGYQAVDPSSGTYTYGTVIAFRPTLLIVEVEVDTEFEEGRLKKNVYTQSILNSMYRFQKLMKFANSCSSHEYTSLLYVYLCHLQINPAPLHRKHSNQRKPAQTLVQGSLPPLSMPHGQYCIPNQIISSQSSLAWKLTMSALTNPPIEVPLLEFE